MTTLEHLLLALFLGVAFTVGAASVNLIDLDHRCPKCTLRDYVRIMLNASYQENNPEVQVNLVRGEFHTLWFLAFTFSMAAFWFGAALNTALHLLGDGL